MIIESLLDTDLYKFTMQQCVLHQFPAAEVEYRFKCRTPGVDLTPFIDEINAEIDALCGLYFREDELAYLAGLRFMKPDYIEFLSLFHLKRKYITVERDPSRQSGISICIRGPWLHTIPFEIPVLAIVNEVYFRRTAPDLPARYDKGGGKPPPFFSGGMPLRAFRLQRHRIIRTPGPWRTRSGRCCGGCRRHFPKADNRRQSADRPWGNASALRGPRRCRSCRTHWSTASCRR